jgi:transcriptional regulator with XRE-family HTH domain
MGLASCDGPLSKYSVVRYRKEVGSVSGDLRRAREQKEVAERIGVHETSVFNWEANTAQPDLRCIPKVIEFLGYNPLPEAEGIGARLVRQRTSLGLTQKEAARRLRVDPSTLARWERGERESKGEVRERVEGWLGEDGRREELRRAG